MRRTANVAPIDPDPNALTADQLVAEGLCSGAEAASFLSVSERQLRRLARTKAVPSWRAGKNRVYPLVGLKAYAAKQAREQGVGRN